MIQSSPDLIRRMVQEGHIVGNHTFHHPDMSAISDQSKFQQELEELEQLYQETTGQTLPRFYRPPQGKYSEENLRQAQALGYRTVFWSLAYVDWYVDDQPTAEEAFSKLIPRIHNGAIVLLHSTSRPTPRSWTSCSPAGRTWATPSPPWRTCLTRRHKTSMPLFHRAPGPAPK